MQGLELYISFLNIKKAVSSNPGDFYKAHTKEKLFYTGKKKKTYVESFNNKGIGQGYLKYYNPMRQFALTKTNASIILLPKNQLQSKFATP